MPRRWPPPARTGVRELVLKLLDDMPAEAGESADALLGYRMRATHVGLLFSSDNHRDVAKALSSMREQSKAPVSLLVQPDAGTWFGWLGYHDGVDANRLELLRQAATTAGEQVVIGEPGHGPAGFRRSHHSARRTAELRPTLRNAPSCLCARELRLETFLLENPQSARRFIADELGGLAADTERAQRIRDTLLTWLAVGSQAKAAVGELGVHENTVRMQVRCGAELLGAALSQRRTELLVALRLCEALGPEADEGASSRPVKRTSHRPPRRWMRLPEPGPLRGQERRKRGHVADLAEPALCLVDHGAEVIEAEALLEVGPPGRAPCRCR